MFNWHRKGSLTVFLLQKLSVQLFIVLSKFLVVSKSLLKLFSKIKANISTKLFEKLHIFICLLLRTLSINIIGQFKANFKILKLYFVKGFLKKKSIFFLLANGKSIENYKVISANYILNITVNSYCS